MLKNSSALAMVPKAKHMAAQCLTAEEYKALTRRRTVLEVVATLQNHPYFSKTLGGISQTNPHREQIEQALSKDLFYKFEKLMRYCAKDGHFGAYFIVRCEIDEILQKLRLMGVGFSEQYILQMPGFLLSKTKLPLLKLAEAKTHEEVCSLLAGTPYFKIMQSVVPKQGEKTDYTKYEHAFESFFYDYVFKKIDEDISGKAAKETKILFSYRAEIYNLDVIFRAKAFYSKIYNYSELTNLLLPHYGVLKKKEILKLAAAKDLDEFLHIYASSKAAKIYGERSADFLNEKGTKPFIALRNKAQKMLHFSIVPETVLAALLCFADIERSNIVTVIEGVRYGLEPEKIEKFLKM